MLCGCTTTSIFSAWQRRRSQRASILFQPFIEHGGRVDGDLCGPCSRWDASAPVPAWHVSQVALPVQVRKAPPEAVRIRRETASGPPWLPFRHWKMALCSLSTGSTCTPARRAFSMTICPAMTRISLLAMARSLPASIAASAGLRPAVPTMEINTMSASESCARRHSPSSPVSTCAPGRARASSSAADESKMHTLRTLNSRAWRASASTLVPAASPTISILSGISRATFRALVPMEPGGAQDDDASFLHNGEASCKKYGPLTSRGDENFPRAAWAVFPSARFIPAGRGKAATRSCRRRFVPWVAAFLLACQAGRAGKERAWEREGMFRRMEKGCIFLRRAYSMALNEAHRRVCR